MNLRIPGPTPLPPHVIDAVGQQMIDHRGPQFEAMLQDIVSWAKVFLETEGDVYLLTCSGTGGMEAAIVNTLSPGDRVLAVSIGSFGERFAKIASAYGAQVTMLSYPMGSPADPAQVAAKVVEEGPFAAVLLTQNETSSGVTNDTEALCRAIHDAADPAPLILIDAISGVPAIRLCTDAWGCDVVVTASQKAWMAPPGAVLLTFSQRAWAAYERARMPRFYLDLGQARQYAARHQTPATPSVPVVFGLHASLERMVQEGREAFQERHIRIGEYARGWVRTLGLGLFARPGYESNTVSAVKLGSQADAMQVLRALRERYGIIVGASKAPGVEMIRIGHMGYVSEQDLDEVFQALGEILESAG
ncbi:MAG: alanine--glyoxylate aminotransferase family protein [Chloroflexi bacterium]|nr:alanine--glyoxylate aminotransferase family protein [Chloroflexota bacterium]